MAAAAAAAAARVPSSVTSSGARKSLEFSPTRQVTISPAIDAAPTPDKVTRIAPSRLILLFV